MKSFRVGLLYSLRANAPQDESDETTPWDKWNELDSEKSVEGYARALRAGGHEVIPLEGDWTLLDKLNHYKVDICFNTCEGHRGVSREAQVPALLDMLGIPYTGAGVMTLAIALDKAMTKRVLQFYGIPTPAFQVFTTGNEPLDARLNLPLFAKPALEGSGIGVSGESICRTPRELRERVRYLLRAYKQQVLVEEYVEGREITAGIIGNLVSPHKWDLRRTARGGSIKKVMLPQPQMAMATGALVAGGSDGNGKANSAANGKPRAIAREYYASGVRVLPPLEVDFSPLGSETAPVYSSEIKSKNPWGPRYLIPAPLSAKLTAQIGRFTVATFRALECFDFARVDFRLRASDNQPFVLEINPLAGLTEGYSDLALEANAAGMTYVELINGILAGALRRYGLLEDN